MSIINTVPPFPPLLFHLAIVMLMQMHRPQSSAYVGADGAGRIDVW
jgi:hypothetical protein